MIRNNIVLNLKYTFLNFLQALFSLDPVYTWDPDVQKTKIIIADRHAVDIGVAVHRPSIILQRGEVGWTYSVRGQDATNAIMNYNGKSLQNLFAHTPAVSDPSNVRTYTDLLRGFVVFNVVSKNGIQAEIIADKLFKNLTGYKEELRKSGIRQVSNLTMSQEQIIRANSEIELIGVQVSLGFLQQIHIIKDEKNYNCYAYIGEREVFENHDYLVTDSGTSITFWEVPENPVTIDYTEAITLESRTGIALIPTGNPKVFLIPGGEAVAGYYILNADMVLNVEQV